MLGNLLLIEQDNFRITLRAMRLLYQIDYALPSNKTLG